MKINAAVVLAGVLLTSVACQKESVRIVTQDGLSAEMSDAQILRALNLDPATLNTKEDHGLDGGRLIIYSDQQNEIWITRSVSSGVVVMRLNPKEEFKSWELGNP